MFQKPTGIFSPEFYQDFSISLNSFSTCCVHLHWFITGLTYVCKVGFLELCVTVTGLWKCMPLLRFPVKGIQIREGTIQFDFKTFKYLTQQISYINLSNIEMAFHCHLLFISDACILEEILRKLFQTTLPLLSTHHFILNGNKTMWVRKTLKWFEKSAIWWSNSSVFNIEKSVYT